jgi:hypothetical protein
MTTASARVRIDVPSTDPGAELLLVWSVSRPALAEAWPGVTLPRDPEVSAAFSALLHPTGEVTDVHADVAGHELLAEITREARGAWLRDETTGLLHVRVCEPTSDTPLLDATLRQHANSVELLYARTTLLGLLKLSGGRYEVARAALTPIG